MAWMVQVERLREIALHIRIIRGNDAIPLVANALERFRSKRIYHKLSVSSRLVAGQANVFPGKTVAYSKHVLVVNGSGVVTAGTTALGHNVLNVRARLIDTSHAVRTKATLLLKQGAQDGGTGISVNVSPAHHRIWSIPDVVDRLHELFGGLTLPYR